jgi:NADH dehydrogenase/NADH:ubiquinone oxidoreductase subunit G
MIVELLFAERNHVCAVCVSNGHCELQTWPSKLGMDHVRVPYRRPLRVDASHERFGSTTTAASCARAACASATRSKARTPGT